VAEVDDSKEGEKGPDGEATWRREAAAVPFMVWTVAGVGWRTTDRPWVAEFDDSGEGEEGVDGKATWRREATVSPFMVWTVARVRCWATRPLGGAVLWAVERSRVGDEGSRAGAEEARAIKPDLDMLWDSTNVLSQKVWILMKPMNP
jgi:hypothetical protein